MREQERGNCPYVFPVSPRGDVRVVGYSDGDPGQTNIRVKFGERFAVSGWIVSAAIAAAYVARVRSRLSYDIVDETGGKLVKAHYWQGHSIAVITHTRTGERGMRTVFMDGDDEVARLNEQETAMLDRQLKRLEAILTDDANTQALLDSAAIHRPSPAADGALLTSIAAAE